MDFLLSIATAAVNDSKSKQLYCLDSQDYESSTREIWSIPLPTLDKVPIFMVKGAFTPALTSSSTLQSLATAAKITLMLALYKQCPAVPHIHTQGSRDRLVNRDDALLPSSVDVLHNATGNH